jgi:hypothetical protein
MLRLRRSTAAALLMGAAVIGAAVVAAPAPTAAASSTVAASSTAVSAAAATWTYYATYPSLGACRAAGPGNPYGAPWECRPSPAKAGSYDLWVNI